MDRMVAHCGLVCTECPAYTATKADDAVAIQEVARMWSAEYRTQMNAADVWCDGCLSSGIRLCSHCGECKIRACATSRGVVNCAYCDDYGCDIISGFQAMVPDAKATLDAIRDAL